MEQFIRGAMLLGEEGIKKLLNSKVAVFGVGGVGGYVCEALARTGVGSFLLVDNDTVNLSNINRQIIATHETVGRFKTEVMKERILSINPEASVEIRNCFFLPENSSEFDFSEFDYVVDAVDTVSAKLEIIMKAKEAGVPVISSMGAGNKLDPTKFVVTDIYKTSVCPLAKVMRHECKKRGIKKLKVVYSTELAMKPIEPESINDVQPDTKENDIQETKGKSGRRATPGSVAFVPSVAGLIVASEVVKDILGTE
ncbi:MAG: tRNA threonylcarbamoyladenosine dehydratase [Lachnospiraceae bacterium]|nr:tRNA threonylcarbamoyladenosine dehydratase [Lachnospiraceae bacterium]